MAGQKGFTLVELVAVVVMLGLVAVFAGLFISTGAKGSLMAKVAEENAQKGQIALTRIALELRDVNGGPGGAPALTATSVQYTTSQAQLPGTRTIAYDAAGSRITITPDAGQTPQPLVDGVSNCTMNATGVGTENNVVFNFSFRLNGTNQAFTISVKPRHAINTPVTS